MNQLPHEPTDPLFVTIDGATKIAAIGRTRLYELINSGHIRAKKLGARTLVEADSLRTFMNSLPDFQPRKAA